MFSVAFVSDLCTAIGEYIDDDPKGAATVAKKLGAVLLAQHDREQERAAALEEESKLQMGRDHERRQRELDIRDAELQVAAKHAEAEVAEVEAAARR